MYNIDFHENKHGSSEMETQLESIEKNCSNLERESGRAYEAIVGVKLRQLDTALS